MELSTYDDEKISLCFNIIKSIEIRKICIWLPDNINNETKLRIYRKIEEKLEGFLTHNIASNDVSNLFYF